MKSSSDEFMYCDLRRIQGLGVTINKNHFQMEWNYRKCKLRVYPVNNVQKQPDVDVSVQINLVSFAKIKDGQKSFFEITLKEK